VCGLDLEENLADLVNMVEPLADVANYGGMVYILTKFGGILSNLEDLGLAPANPANFWKSGCWGSLCIWMFPCGSP
jgi:hypothetical protein